MNPLVATRAFVRFARRPLALQGLHLVLGDVRFRGALAGFACCLIKYFQTSNVCLSLPSIQKAESAVLWDGSN